MKNYLLIFVTLLLAITLPLRSHAQTNYEDVVYLKNGSIIHGTIIEQVPNEMLKIQTKDKNIFVYRIDEILKITKEEVPGAPSRSARMKSAMTQERKKSGYTNITELTFAKSFENTTTVYNYGQNSYYEDSHFDEINNNPSVGIQSINGYQFSPYLSAGLGLGVNVYTGVVLMPVFIGVRANFMDKRVTPFLALDAGFAYSRKELIGGSLASDDKGGLMVCPAAGVKFFVIPKMALNLSLGFRYQEIEVYGDSYYQYSYVGTQYTKHSLRLFNLKFGISF